MARRKPVGWVLLHDLERAEVARPSSLGARGRFSTAPFCSGSEWDVGDLGMRCRQRTCALWLGLAFALAGCQPPDPWADDPMFQNLGEQDTTELIWSLLREPGEADPNRDRYLNLMKLSLTDLLYEDDQVGRRKRVEGFDWPSRAYTMVGLRRLNNIQLCVEHALEKDIPGDFIEAGAWRGGATIFMRSLLEAHGVRDRVVWVADSFEGMPPPDSESYPADAGLDLSAYDELAVSLEEVENNFRRHGLLDEQVKPLKGWFKDTLPEAPIEKLAAAAPRRRPLRVDHGRPDPPLPQSLERGLCDHRRLLPRSLSPGRDRLPRGARDHATSGEDRRDVGLLAQEVGAARRVSPISSGTWRPGTLVSRSRISRRTGSLSVGGSLNSAVPTRSPAGSLPSESTACRRSTVGSGQHGS